MAHLVKLVASSRARHTSLPPSTWDPQLHRLVHLGQHGSPPGLTSGQQKSLPQTYHLVVPCTWCSPPTGTLHLGPSSVYTWAHPAVSAWVFQSYSVSTSPLDNMRHQAMQSGIQPPETLSTNTLGGGPYIVSRGAFRDPIPSHPIHV